MVMHAANVGNTPETRRTTYVVYEDVFGHDSTCLWSPTQTGQTFQKPNTKKKKEQLKFLKEKYGINIGPPI